MVKNKSLQRKLGDNAPKRYANRPIRNSSSIMFLILRAFSREGFKSKRAEQVIRPMSVIRTRGINSMPTNPKNHVIGVRATANMKKHTAMAAAVFSPNRTARVFTPSALSPLTSTMPLVISLPVFERKAIAANNITFNPIVPIAVMLP